MTKTEFVKALAEKTGLTQKNAAAVVNEGIALIEGSLKNKESVVFTGFGTFATKERAARVGRNPQTGKEIKIPAKTVVVFKPGKDLK